MRDMTSPPGRPLTIQDIADELGLNKSTVSKALSGRGRLAQSTRERICELAERRNYAPDPLAQSLASRTRSKLVCLCSGTVGLGRGLEKLIFLQTALTGSGLDVPMYTPATWPGQEGRAQSNLFKQLRRLRPRAIILCSYPLRDEAVEGINAYRDEGGIVISFDLPINLDCDQVIYDREDNAYRGVKYLLEHGHRHIGFGMSHVKPSTMTSHATTQSLRLRGFQRALKEYGVTMRREWIFENRLFERGGAEMAQRFLQLRERPTALCIVNDYVALAFMVEVMKAGIRIPEDLSIMGHDNQAIGAYCPVPLTSVDHPAVEITCAVLDRLHQRLEGDTKAGGPVIIRGGIIERKSVAVCNRGGVRSMVASSA